MERYWKVLDAEGRACHGGDFRYDLPRWSRTRGWIPGAWAPAIPDVAPCVRGYHVCRDRDLLDWLGARIYACEVRGTVVVAEDKVVAESIRLLAPTPWDETSARLFAVECAAEVLPLYEAAHPGDTRVSDCLVTAFRYALGDATDADLDAARDAARAAAWDAASDAAKAAARAAARAAQTTRLLWWLGVDENACLTGKRRRSA